MCTLLVFSRVFEAAPLLVANTRDEKLDRPAAPVTRQMAGPQPVLAPTDLEHGGTWVGLNLAGVFCGITNRFGFHRNPKRRSRGDLVLAGLSHPDARAAAQAVAALSAADFTPFHLAIADRNQAFVVWSDGERLHLEDRPPGVFILSERSFDAAPTQREAWLTSQLAPLIAAEPSTDALQNLMATHRTPTFEGPCVHWAEHGYGTRTLTVVRLGQTPGDVRYLTSDGPPCTTPLRDYSAAWRSLKEPT